ncbi:DUF1588 domain-containing protein [Luteolibacter algae]|uniref:DUF1588 domain-containing protein n=1 Tax=Luteolibacter algae TaxID=454151 RepID=A0ABW5D466_9BACT
MHKFNKGAISALTILALAPALPASPELMQIHCFDCHNDEKAKGKFKLEYLKDAPDSENLERWLDCLDYVSAEEMPPEEDSKLTSGDREIIIAYLEAKIREHDEGSAPVAHAKPRRLNNREFSNSVRDALLLDSIGTNQPMDNLVGDTLHHGFDTHGETLGFSRYHLEQYIESIRKIVDATILEGEKPEVKTYKVSAEDIRRGSLNQNVSRDIVHSKDGSFDFLDPRLPAYFKNFQTVPETGRYRIKIRATGKDRTVYDTKFTGIYEGDPIQLSVHLGDEIHTYDLPDEEMMEIEIDDWLAAGTRLELRNPTDGFTLRGNGNFKFQYGIAPDHLKENDPQRYASIAAKIREELKYGKVRKRERNVDRWQSWTEYWEGARPRIFSAEIVGPIFETWPSERQVALIGSNPDAANALEILQPIAERAWRRPVREGELDTIVDIVASKVDSLGHIGALKEGIVAILASPAFLMIGVEDVPPASRFATKYSYLLRSTLPTPSLVSQVQKGELDSFTKVRENLKNLISRNQADEFIREFPTAWLELGNINFMAPDPEQYRLYHRKRLSEDMVNETLTFFRHAMLNNIPLPELLSADYSFINADLAEIYGVEGVPEDSKLRKYHFTDGRRGGLLGMGSFLTSTADTLSTSPIHRAVYVMENLMGITPTPPPADVLITEPDVRQAKSIKEILAAHTSDPTCTSCHETIDPWGYAFESFDPTGAWRDFYTVPDTTPLDENATVKSRKKILKSINIPVDASASFRSGAAYDDIRGFREQIMTDANRDRFVRCFISKFLLYANGEEPLNTDFVEINNILEVSAAHDYRIVDTIAAIIDSPLFRQR